MKAKERMYAVIGGCVGTVMTMVVCSFLPIGAQSQGEHVFGEITCTALKVVDAENHEIITLGIDSHYNHGVIRLYGDDGNARNSLMLSGGDGLKLASFTDNRGLAMIFHDEHGGLVRVVGTEGRIAKVGIDENGGVVSVFGKGGNTSRAVMGVNKYGEGAISTWDKNGYRQ